MESKADLHNHLRTSSNLGQGDFNRAVDLARQRLGENGIFAMVNFSDRRYEDFIGLRGYERDYLGENRNAVYVPGKKVLIVKGQEIPTQQGHLLVLGLNHGIHMSQYKSLEYSLKEAEDKRGIVVADHPFNGHGIGNYLFEHLDLVSFLDAMEVFNGETSLSPKANAEAIRLYQIIKNNFPFLGALSSSDGHSFYELGRNWTEIDTPSVYNTRDFIPSLKLAVRRTDLGTKRQNKPSKIGALDHMTDLIWICKIAPRIGLRRLYETERPEN